MSMAIQKFRAILRKASITHARKLIKAGKIKNEARWSGPSPSSENAYIEERGFLRFSDWFLGLDEEEAPDTKGRFKYPFTDDFKTISVRGLGAIRSRAAQNDETEIFEEAGRLLELINEREEDSMETSDPGKTRLTFQMKGGAVDRAAGTIDGITIIEGGEARGHRMMVSDRSLDVVADLLNDKILPAYISHNGAQSDRLMEEIGAFSGFYRADDKIRAGRFEALPSFKEHEPERFDRLFDLADKMPATFGISIVFEGALFWETEEGADVPFEGFAERPEGAEYELPTIEPSRIFSADFVDTPAATASLFNANPANDLNDPRKVEGMKIKNEQLDESASAVLERRRAAKAAEDVEETPEPKKKKAKAKKKELAEESDEEAPEAAPEESAPEPAEEPAPDAEEAGDDAPVEAEASEGAASPELLEMALDQYRSRITERDTLITDQSTRLEELEIENRALRRALGGAEELAAEGEAEEAKPESVKNDLINKYLEDNPTHTRITAILEVGKAQPQIFNN
jgi:hypothetical protein